MDGLIEGREVHFVESKTKHYPATVTKVVDRDKGLVNLAVFNDDTKRIDWRNAVPFEEEGRTHRTWHWIERA